MRTTRIFLVFSFLILFFGARSQNGGCYEIKKSMSGFGTALYPQDMFEYICDLAEIVDEIDSNNIDFKVLSYDLYPITQTMALDDIELQKAQVKNELLAYQEYIAVIKSFVNDNIEYSIILKLPTTGKFSTINSLEFEAIQNGVERAMREANEILPGNKQTEIHGFTIFNGYISMIKNGNLNIDIFRELGFIEVELSQDADFQISESSLSDNSIKDFCGLKINNNLLREILRETSSNIESTNSIAYIITSSNMPDYQSKIINAKSLFNSKPEEFVIWLHFIISSDSTQLLTLAKGNMDAGRAENIIDIEWEAALYDYYNCFYFSYYCWKKLNSIYT